MQPKEINILLALVDLNKTVLADEIGEERAVVTMTLNGQRKNRRIQEKIMEAIQSRLTVDKVFGERQVRRNALAAVATIEGIPAADAN